MEVLDVGSIVREFEDRWSQNQEPDFSLFLSGKNELEQRVILVELIRSSVELRARKGMQVDLDSYLRQFPELRLNPGDILQLLYAECQVFRDLGRDLDKNELLKKYPELSTLIEDGFSDSTEAFKSEARKDTSSIISVETPRQIGHYRIERILGRGSFGSVYLAVDIELGRKVAVKVPRPDRVYALRDLEAYKNEARNLARLDQPGILPILAVGFDEKYPFYLVTKYLEGEDLAARLKRELVPFQETARWLATIAASLHHAHGQGLIHRDIKPANILIDRKNEPWILDFGLALRDDQVGFGKALVGTPVYMSPEQARRQGHRIDGRSDIFSLGIIFYEMLCNRKPFLADNLEDLIRQIVETEPKPPRQRNETIPRELERICLKALSKHARDRYPNASEMARDLQSWLVSAGEIRPNATDAMPIEPGSGSVQDSFASGSSDQSSAVSARVVPKGLRSFDGEDADFFLALLPGPKDRDGLPDSLRYWKKRIEAVTGFQVGVMYGPSGCGKSSLVKAGLIPNLDSQKTVALYLESSPQETEGRLKAGVMKSCGIEDRDVSLADLFFFIRNGRYQPLRGKKLVLVIDQFEQWLHEKNGMYHGELAQALGQCDGTHIQALLLVRDDFWMATTRFMNHLEVELVPEENLQGVDLFDLGHAEKVLTAIGRAQEKLPEYPKHIRSAQKKFVLQAVEELSQENRVITVRLTLFAEMMKHRDWTIESLRAVGGVGGLGFTFLEETFEGKHAPPENRLHQPLCKAILRALLPADAVEITGARLSLESLLKQSGSEGHPEEFSTALRILEKNLRLITSMESVPVGDSGKREGDFSYQITHDYLVPSIRDWLLKKQKETARGRAEILLAERSELWQAKRQARYLPSFSEYLKIQWLTGKNSRNKQQQEMMRQARGRYAKRFGLVAALLLASLGGLRQWYGTIRAENLTEQLASARPEEVFPTIRSLEPYMGWAEPLLEKYQKEQPDKSAWLPATIALLSRQPGLIGEIFQHLGHVEPGMLPVLNKVFSTLPVPASFRKETWEKALDGRLQDAERLRVLSVLAGIDAESGNWEKVSTFLAQQLAGQDAAGLLFWKERMRPIGKSLVPSLIAILDNSANEQQVRSFALEALLDYASDDRETIFSLMARAPVRLLPRVMDIALRQTDFHIPRALTEIGGKTKDPTDPQELEKGVMRKANLAIFLLNTNRRDMVWPLLKTSEDPSLRTELLHALPKTNFDPRVLAERLAVEKELSVRSALLLSLGSSVKGKIDPATRTSLSQSLLLDYESNQDPGCHGATEWLLRQWGFDQELEKVKARILAAGPPAKKQAWYLSGEGLTLIRIPKGVARIGSPENEKDRGANESLHQADVENDFYISSTEIPRNLFKRYLLDNKLPLVMENPFFAQSSKSEMDPEVAVSWFDAARFCNWLSKKEGIPESEWCYEPAPLVDPRAEKSGGYAEGMVIRAGHKSLKGYRLPTVVEWEYACRANTTSVFYFGDYRRLLENYGWFNENSKSHLWPVHSLKPNDWGLFGCYGNAMEWCQNATGAHQGDGNEQETVTRANRVIRGGSIMLGSTFCRSAARNSAIPGSHGTEVGFRVVIGAE